MTPDMNGNGLLHDLAACLQREIRLGEQLLEAMRREHKALTTRDTALLNEAVAHKSELITAMQVCGGERNSLLHAEGMGTDRTAMDRLLDRHDAQRHSGLRRDWARLLEIGAECQRQNLINGVIIQAGQQQIRQALAILRGQPVVAGGEYGPEGMRPSSPSSHPLARA